MEVFYYYKINNKLLPGYLDFYNLGNEMESMLSIRSNLLYNQAEKPAKCITEKFECDSWFVAEIIKFNVRKSGNKRDWPKSNFCIRW